jgi:uncharacterized protein YjiS (DUF1127 family)
MVVVDDILRMEGAMNTISLHLTVHAHGGWRLSQVIRQASDWWNSARSRYELQNLDDRCLQDIGMSRCSADFEAAKPFCMA